jgi:hypothetical protein
MKSQMTDFFERDSGESRHHEYTFRLEEFTETAEHATRFREPVKIHNHQPRQTLRSKKLPRKWPAIGGEDVISLFEELRAQ